MNWYVLFVMGGKEQKICDFLDEAGFDAFVPRMEVLYHKRGKYYPIEKPMFPSYIFIESSLEHIAFHQQMMDLRKRRSGIIRELRFDNEGTPALKEEEKALIERLIGRNRLMEHSIGYMEGDRVIVTEGPLQGLESKIIRMDRHKRRGQIEVNMLGQTVKLSVSLEIVKKI